MVKNRLWERRVFARCLQYEMNQTEKMFNTAFLLLAVTGVALGFPKSIRTNTRIINGAVANTGVYPWQVSLQEPYGSGYWHFCGGSLISENYIMTAAHCHKLPARVTVYAGSVDKFNGGQRLEIQSFLAHPEYNSNEISMDYAVIQLRQAVVVDSTINTIPIPGPEYDSISQFAGPAITTGWGYIQYDGSNAATNEMPQILQVASIPVLSDTQCDNYWGTFYQSSNMICAGASREGVCMGDSGGPLVQDINGVTTLIGATSWAPSSCTAMLPSGWAKLSSVRAWILENTDLEE